MRAINCKKLVPLALILFCLLPAHAVALLEGRIAGGTKHTGSYDLLLQVWCQSGNTDTIKLFQTIQIPKVNVVDGGFQIPLDTGLEPREDFKLSYTVQSRPFETWQPFQPAQVSGVSTVPVTPGLVLR